MAAVASALLWLKKRPLDRRALFLLALTVLFFFAPFAADRFYATGDMRSVFVPLESFFHSSELAGKLPSWEPQAAWGFPVIAAAQIGFFYPPLLLSRWLPVVVYIPMLLVLHFLALATGLYLFLRTLGRSYLASYLGAISFTLGTFVLQHVTHLNIAFVVAWLPWQLLVIHRSRRASLTAFLLGIPFLAGQLQIPFMMAAVSSIYLLIHWREKSLLRRCGIVALLAVLVIALAAAQLFPTLELAKESSRGTGGDFSLVRANQYSFPLYHLPTLLFPYFFGNDATYWGKRLEIEYGFFIGTVPLFLAAWALLKKRFSGFFWPLLALISFLLALGSLSPFHFIGIEPSLWIFSAPTRWLLFTTFALSTLAAHGFDALPKTAPRMLKISTGILGAGVLLVNIVLFLIPIHSSVSKINELLSYARYSSVSVLQPYTFLPLIILLITLFSWQKQYFKILLVGLTVTELLLVGWHVSPYVPWSIVTTPPATLQALPASVRSGEARLISERTGGDTGAYFTDPSSRANATTRAQESELLVPLVSSQFGISGVEWPASLDLKSQGAILSHLRPEGSYQITNSELAQELNIGAVTAPADFPAPASAKKITTMNGVALYTYSAQPRISSTTGTAVLTQDEQTHLVIHVLNKSAGAVLIRDTYFPGWKATVDGASTPINPYLGIFRSVAVPAGEHTVELSYQPHPLFIGLAVSVIAILACFIMLALKV